MASFRTSSSAPRCGTTPLSPSAEVGCAPLRARRIAGSSLERCCSLTASAPPPRASRVGRCSLARRPSLTRLGAARRSPSLGLLPLRLHQEPLRQLPTGGRQPLVRRERSCREVGRLRLTPASLPRAAVASTAPRRTVATTAAAVACALSRGPRPPPLDVGVVSVALAAVAGFLPAAAPQSAAPIRMEGPMSLGRTCGQR